MIGWQSFWVTHTHSLKHSALLQVVHIVFLCAYNHRIRIKICLNVFQVSSSSNFWCLLSPSHTAATTDESVIPWWCFRPLTGPESFQDQCTASLNLSDYWCLSDTLLLVSLKVHFKWFCVKSQTEMTVHPVVCVDLCNKWKTCNQSLKARGHVVKHLMKHCFLTVQTPRHTEFSIFKGTALRIIISIVCWTLQSCTFCKSNFRTEKNQKLKHFQGEFGVEPRTSNWELAPW